MLHKDVIVAAIGIAASVFFVLCAPLAEPHITSHVLPLRPKSESVLRPWHIKAVVQPAVNIFFTTYTVATLKLLTTSSSSPSRHKPSTCVTIQTHAAKALVAHLAPRNARNRTRPTSRTAHTRTPAPMTGITGYTWKPSPLAVHTRRACISTPRAKSPVRILRHAPSTSTSMATVAAVNRDVTVQRLKRHTAVATKEKRSTRAALAKNMERRLGSVNARFAAIGSRLRSTSRTRGVGASAATTATMAVIMAVSICTTVTVISVKRGSCFQDGSQCRQGEINHGMQRSSGWIRYNGSILLRGLMSHESRQNNRKRVSRTEKKDVLFFL